MCRLKAKDLTSNSKKKEEKEYITYYEDWYGKNWLGEKLINRDNIEGVYNEVETVPEVSFNNETGRSEVVGKKLAGTRLVHYILFSKETVDKIIANSDSDKGEILYKVKSPPNNDYFNYDEFTNYSWEQLEKILLTAGGSKAVRLKAQQEKEKALATTTVPT